MESKPTAVSGFSKPAAANPVMDVVAAPPAEHEAPKADHEIDPLDKLAAEDQAARASSKKSDKKTEAKTKPAESKAATSQGVGLAITATVIIVLGLAVLATYAYLQTAK